MESRMSATKTLVEKPIILGGKAQVPNTIQFLRLCAALPWLVAVIYGIFLVFAFLQVLFAHANFWSFLIALVIYLGLVAVLIRILALILTDFDHVERTYGICTDLYHMLKSRPQLSEEEQNLLSRLTNLSHPR